MGSVALIGPMSAIGKLGVQVYPGTEGRKRKEAEGLEDSCAAERRKSAKTGDSASEKGNCSTLQPENGVCKARLSAAEPPKRTLLERESRGLFDLNAPSCGDHTKEAELMKLQQSAVGQGITQEPKAATQKQENIDEGVEAEEGDDSDWSSSQHQVTVSADRIEDPKLHNSVEGDQEEHQKLPTANSRSLQDELAASQTSCEAQRVRLNALVTELERLAAVRNDIEQRLSTSRILLEQRDDAVRRMNQSLQAAVGAKDQAERRAADLEDLVASKDRTVATLSTELVESRETERLALAILKYETNTELGGQAMDSLRKHLQQVLQRRHFSIPSDPPRPSPPPSSSPLFSLGSKRSQGWQPWKGPETEELGLSLGGSPAAAKWSIGQPGGQGPPSPISSAVVSLAPAWAKSPPGIPQVAQQMVKNQQQRDSEDKQARHNSRGKRKCPECSAMIAAAAADCGHCGHMFRPSKWNRRGLAASPSAPASDSPSHRPSSGKPKDSAKPSPPQILPTNAPFKRCPSCTNVLTVSALKCSCGYSFRQGSGSPGRGSSPTEGVPGVRATSPLALSNPTQIVAAAAAQVAQLVGNVPFSSMAEDQRHLSQGGALATLAALAQQEQKPGLAKQQQQGQGGSSAGENRNRSVHAEGKEGSSADDSGGLSLTMKVGGS